MESFQIRDLLLLLRLLLLRRFNGGHLFVVLLVLVLVVVLVRHVRLFNLWGCTRTVLHWILLPHWIMKGQRGGLIQYAPSADLMATNMQLPIFFPFCNLLLKIIITFRLKVGRTESFFFLSDTLDGTESVWKTLPSVWFHLYVSAPEQSSVWVVLVFLQNLELLKVPEVTSQCYISIFFAGGQQETE